MSDRFFFPLIILAGLFIGSYAFNYGRGDLPQGSVSGTRNESSDVMINGANLNRIINRGMYQTRISAIDDQNYLLTIISGSGSESPNPELGPHFRLAADVEQAFQGKTIEITVRARPAPSDPAHIMMLNYSAGPAGDSGWKEFELAPEFSDYKFTVDVPKRFGPQGVDYLGIRPKYAGFFQSIAIESVMLQLKPESP